MSNTGLALIAYESLLDSQGLYSREYVDDITGKHEKYDHIISAVGGFDQAKFVLKGNRDYLDAWFDEGLMRRVVLYNPQAVAVWEGFVERMSYTIGTLQKTKSVSNVINKVYMKFAPLDTAASPTIAGVPITLGYDDLNSQATWGVKVSVVNGGELTHAEAYAWAQAILSSQADPQMGENVNTTKTDMPNIQVEVKGYYHILDWVPYWSSDDGDLPAQQVMGEVLSYFNTINPGWISTDYGWMDWNYRPERRRFDEMKTCWQVIKDIIKRGGASGERWVGGLYQGRQMIYKAAEDFKTLYSDYLFYTRRLGDPSQRIYDATGSEIPPWDVVPDRVLITVDV